MDTIRDFFSNNAGAIALYGGLVLALIGTVATIYAYLRTHRFKRLAYATRSVVLIKDYKAIISEMKVLHGKNEVPNVTITRFAIWNDGREVIDKEDIAPADNVRITCRSPYCILTCQILNVTDQVTRFAVAGVTESAVLQFDFLSPGDGAIVQVAHTGQSDNDANLHGTIKGARPLKKYTLVRKRIVGIDKIVEILLPAFLLFAALVTSIWSDKYGFFLLAGLGAATVGWIPLIPRLLFLRVLPARLEQYHSDI